MNATRWVRFEHAGTPGLGTLAQDRIRVHEGDLFGGPQPTGVELSLAEVRLAAPLAPGKIVALWNNFHALAAKLGKPVPTEPLYFLKASSSVIGPGAAILRPPGYEGKIVFEGELGIVIGRRVAHASRAEARAAIFGFTCVNDVTALDIIERDPTFAQWCRAKGFDTFGALGPAIATDFDWSSARVVTTVDDSVRQDYPLSDLVFQPEELVARISADMTLLPGDLIACGTSLGVGSLKPGARVAITIEGIGTLANALAP